MFWTVFELLERFLNFWSVFWTFGTFRMMIPYSLFFERFGRFLNVLNQFWTFWIGFELLPMAQG